MRTISKVHTPEERLAQRQAAQLCAWRSLWRMAACASILRTAVTRLLPLCGAAAWWMTAACLAPGLVCYGLCCMALRLTRTQSLPECARLLLGRTGETALSLLCGAVVAVDGVSSMTALVTLFTQGIGARGTQLTMAVLTGLLLLPCLQRDGLTSGVRFLSRLMLALLGMAAVNLLLMARPDGVFPWQGSGALAAAARQEAGMGWVFLLPLMRPAPSVRARLTDPVAPLLMCVGCILLLNLALPHELLTSHAGLADSMLLTVSFLAPMLDLTTVCLWMLGLFLHAAFAARQGADCLLQPWGREAAFLPYALTALLVLSQAWRVGETWRLLGLLSPWLLVPLALSAAVLPAAGAIRCLRRKRT